MLIVEKFGIENFELVGTHSFMVIADNHNIGNVYQDLMKKTEEFVESQGCNAATFYEVERKPYYQYPSFIGSSYLVSFDYGKVRL